MITLLFVLLYVIPMIFCFLMAWKILKTDWNDYTLGGPVKVSLCIFFGFLPIFNIAYILTIIPYYIGESKLKNEKNKEILKIPKIGTKF